jgi:hypothetical protein
MKFLKHLLGWICLFSFTILGSTTCFAWGFYAHQQINRHAVFALPPELFGFYKRHIEYLTEHAVDPDKRRYLIEGEGVKHFMDMDHFEQVLPFDTMPRKYQDACEKYSKDTIHAYGLVPWNIQWMLRQLTEAFSKHDVPRVLKLSAELGHYVGDAHVPLHSTENYNGQLSGQHGIHGFFETRLPELFFQQYDFFVGMASYLHEPLGSAWKAVEESFACLPKVFNFEKEVQASIPEADKFSYLLKNNLQVRVYSVAISEAYHQKLEGMIEARLQAAILSVASFWYTAWVDAGQPNIEDWQETTLLKAELDSLSKQLPTKMLGRDEGE